MTIDPPEPVLGVRLQRRAHPGRDGRARSRPSASPCRPALAAGGDGAVVGRGRRELAAPARLRRAPRGRRTGTRGGAVVRRLREAWFLGAVALAALGVAGGVDGRRPRDRCAARRTSRGRRPGTLAFSPADVRITAGADGRARPFTQRRRRSSTTGRSRASPTSTPARGPGQTQRIRFRDRRARHVRASCCTVAGHAEAGMAGTLVVEPGRLTPAMSDARRDRDARRSARPARRLRASRRRSTSASRTPTRWATSTTRVYLTYCEMARIRVLDRRDRRAGRGPATRAPRA